MALTTLTVAKIFTYVDQKRVYTPQDGSQGLNQKFRALSRVLWDLKSSFVLPWDEVTQTISYLNSNTEYSAPVDLDHIISFDPQAPNVYQNKITLKSIEEFLRMDTRFVQNICAVDYSNGKKKLRLKYRSLKAPIAVDNADGVTTNGTWVGTVGASGLAQDQVEFLFFSGSLSYNILTGQSSAVLTNSTQQAVDLSAHSGVSHLLMSVFIPSAALANVTSFTLSWGSSSSAYWSVNVTTAINGGAFQAGWQTLDFAWPSNASVGVPNATSTTFVQFTTFYNSSQANTNNFRINNIRSVVPESVVMRYSTAYIGKTNTGVYLDEIADTSNTVLFSQTDTKFMKVVIDGCTMELTEDDYQHEGQDGSKWRQVYEKGKQMLRLEYPVRTKYLERRANIRSNRRRMTSFF